MAIDVGRSPFPPSRDARVREFYAFKKIADAIEAAL